MLGSASGLFNEIANALAFSGPRDHLMFIPLQYWSIVYFGAALIYLLLGQTSPDPASQNQESPSSSVVVVAARRQ
jgi:hypothetical protein